MSRLTLRLPDSLHLQLESLAENEQVSLNQYIVYALTRQTTLDYTIQAIPEKVLAEQRAHYTTLLQSLGQASFEEIERALDERES
ncbi:MAG TPA: toxin-antitoxin system HicB family antitoxin, partial [Anaerolineales bacterium]|nr:toxin-antitoxin system HicB family antitoxin [Anaerolineales bacterium]